MKIIEMPTGSSKTAYLVKIKKNIKTSLNSLKFGGNLQTYTKETKVRQ